MQCERVGAESMRRVPFQVFGQVDNINGFKGTFLDTNTATCVDIMKKQDVFLVKLTTLTLNDRHRQTAEKILLMRIPDADSHTLTD